MKYFILLILFCSLISADLIKAEISPNNSSTTKTNEIVINKSHITNNIIYESNDIKSQRLALYFFCALLILIIISMKVENYERTRNNSENNFRNNWFSKRVYRGTTSRSNKEA